MPKYRKKPVIIEAVQWDPDDMEVVGSVIGSMMVNGLDASIGNDDKNLLINTLEGTMSASRGDWIIKGVAGEFYPCKPDIFEATYEKMPD